MADSSRALVSDESAVPSVFKEDVTKRAPFLQEDSLEWAKSDKIEYVCICEVGSWCCGVKVAGDWRCECIEPGGCLSR